MNSDKPIIFISHAAADSDLATVFKKDVESSFLGMCSLFVSSNLDSIEGGSEWMRRIHENLSNCRIFIGLLSPIALNRPWIYTEFGAGWIREIPTISVCHSGLKKSQLPVPLSHFQALNLTDVVHLEHLYERIASAIGCAKPERDLPADIAVYTQITEVQRRQRLIEEWFAQLRIWNPELNKSLASDELEIIIPSTHDSQFQQFKFEVEEEKYLTLEPRGMAMGTRVGMQASVWLLRKGSNYKSFLEQINVE